MFCVRIYKVVDHKLKFVCQFGNENLSIESANDLVESIRETKKYTDANGDEQKLTPDMVVGRYKSVWTEI